MPIQWYRAARLCGVRRTIAMSGGRERMRASRPRSIALFGGPLSGCRLEKGFLQWLRQVDREEAIRSVAVVFATLVHDP
jgi:hypothetical protein